MIPEPDKSSDSRIIAELRVCFEELFELHDVQLTAWKEQHLPQELPPEWVTNAKERLMMPYVQWMEDLDNAPPTLENFGKVLGALKFATESFLNLAPLLAWHKRLGNLKKAKTMLQPLRVVMVAIRLTVRSMLHKVQEYPANETTSFYQGYHFALKHNLVGDDGKPIIKNDATVLYLFLIVFWKAVEQQKSFAELHAWLGKFFPRDVLGDIDRLKGVCKKIKLRVGKRGRPKEQNK
jgi:hypothetical protein